MSVTFIQSPDVENIIANQLREYLVNDIKFNTLFIGQEVKVSTDHPFVDLMQQDIPEGGKYDLKSGFPSVTIIDTNFDKEIDLPVNPVSKLVSYSILQDIEDFGRDWFILSKSGRTLLRKYFEDNDREDLNAMAYETQRRAHISMEIWAQNNLVKSKLFDIVSMYLINEKKFELHNDKKITIEEHTINGERSGVYNFDFGEILYGSILRFDVMYHMGSYVISEMTVGASVETTVINNDIE